MHSVLWQLLKDLQAACALIQDSCIISCTLNNLGQKACPKMVPYAWSSILSNHYVSGMNTEVQSYKTKKIPASLMQGDVQEHSLLQ
jgi:hypothetical protein